MAFLVLALALLGPALRGYSTAISPRGNDLTIYLNAARAVLEGRSPMGVEDYIYLPVFAVLLSPLAWLPMSIAAGLWQLLSWIAILWSARAVADLVGDERSRTWLPWFCLLATFRLLDSNLSYGQANGFTMAAILKALQLARSGRGVLAGSLAGAAAAFKVLPGVLLGYFLIRGRWLSVFSGGVVFLLLAAGLPALMLGSSVAHDAQRRWYSDVFLPYQRGGSALFEAQAYVPGQSLTPTIYHALADTQISGSDPQLRANFVSWDLDRVRIIVVALNLLHVLLAVLVMWRGRRSRDPDAFVMHGALAICTVLLVAPLVHRAHMLWIMLPLGLLAARASRSPSRELALKLGLGVSIALIGLTTSAILGKTASRWRLRSCG